MLADTSATGCSHNIPGLLSRGLDIFSPRRRSLFFTVVGALTLSLAGCSSSDKPAPVASSPTSTVIASPRCAASAAPLAALPAKAAGEPILAVPQPAGWELSTAPMSEAPTARAALGNAGLRSNGFSPSALVTLVDVTSDNDTPERALAVEQAGLAQAVGHFTTQLPGTLCGFPSATITYTVDGRQDTQRIVAVKDRLAHIWVVSVQIQSADPANIIFAKDKQTILDGFQITVPGTE